jgi:hypothetical protein
MLIYLFFKAMAGIVKAIAYLPVAIVRMLTGSY